MNEIFVVKLTSGKGLLCELALPATDYELLDTLEQLRMTPGEEPGWDITKYTDFRQLHVFFDDVRSVYELNALSRRLDSMDHGQLAAFEGLIQMAIQKREGPMSMADLLTYANSTDCCHVVGEATDDASLGRFYAENGFVPELDNLPDSVFEMLDFAKIGSEMRGGEDGIFTKYGYVVRNEDLKPVTEPVDTIPQIPNYAFRLLIGRYPFENDDQPKKKVYLELPTTEERIVQALEECGAASWKEVVYETVDCAIPRQENSMDCDDISQFNELAKIVKRLEADGELPKLKAVLHATNCDDVGAAVAIAEALDEYVYEPEKRRASDVALEHLRSTVSEPTLSTLLQHVILGEYGMDLMDSENAMMTPYGLVERKDGSILLAPKDRPSHVGMQIQ